MVIKSTPQVLKRISMRWLPQPAFENTDTVALNVGGYYMDLRIATSNGSLEWSRAGERTRLVGDAQTYRWTRIIDSLGSTQADEAAFETLPEGDDLEFGTFSKEGVPTPYEEIWRDVTEDYAGDRYSWILQSLDGSTFVGKVGNILLGMYQAKDGDFAVRKEVSSQSGNQWETVFESGHTRYIPKAATVMNLSDSQVVGLIGAVVQVQGVDFVIRGSDNF